MSLPAHLRVFSTDPLVERRYATEPVLPKWPMRVLLALLLVAWSAAAYWGQP